MGSGVPEFSESSASISLSRAITEGWGARAGVFGGGVCSGGAGAAFSLGAGAAFFLGAGAAFFLGAGAAFSLGAGAASSRGAGTSWRSGASGSTGTTGSGAAAGSPSPGGVCWTACRSRSAFRLRRWRRFWLLVSLG